MSTEENKDLVRRAYEEGYQGNWAVFDALFAPDFVLHNASSTIQGFEAYKQLLLSGDPALPYGHFILEDLIAEGDRVVVRHTLRGTHQGKQITMSGIGIYRVTNGKIVEQWVNNDNLGLLQQLGTLPAPGQAS